MSQSAKRTCLFQVKCQIGESLVERLEKGTKGKAEVRVGKEEDFERFSKWFLMRSRRV